MTIQGKRDIHTEFDHMIALSLYKTKLWTAQRNQNTVTQNRHLKKMLIYA